MFDVRACVCARRCVYVCVWLMSAKLSFICKNIHDTIINKVILIFSSLIEHILLSPLLGSFKRLKNKMMLNDHGQHMTPVLYQKTNNNVSVNIKNNC